MVFGVVSILLSIFAFWRLSGYPLSISEIHTFKAELIFWTAILFSNTLGTALGDFLSDSSGFGFTGGAFLIGGLLLLTALAAFYSRMSKTLLFWIAFVLTRPFGATLGDTLTKSHTKGGLNFGTFGSSLVLGLILGIMIWHTTVNQSKVAMIKVNESY